MKQRKSKLHWTWQETLLVAAAWVVAIILLVAVIIKIRVLF
jgi:hypothetical protein